MSWMVPAIIILYITGQWFNLVATSPRNEFRKRRFAYHACAAVSGLGSLYLVFVVLHVVVGGLRMSVI